MSMKLRSKPVLVGALIAVGLGIALAVGLRGGHRTTPGAGQPPAPVPRGDGGVTRAFERFADRCLAGDPSAGCSHAAAVLLGRFAIAEGRFSVKARRLVRICAKATPPRRCSQKHALLADLSTLEAAVRKYASKVKAAYDVSPIAPSSVGPRGSPRGTLTGSVVQTDRTWVCNRPVRVDSVRVTITPNTPRHQGVGIRLDAGCTGTIASIHVVTSIGDGVDVHAAHDLTIDGGSIVCNGRAAEAHQDGIQATAGANVVFRRVTVDCRTANNSGFFVNAIPGSPAVPHRILFLDGHIGPTLGSTVFIARHQTASGVANSVLCRSRYTTFRTGPNARAINRGNSFPRKC